MLRYRSRYRSRPRRRSTRRRNPAGPLLMINPSRPKRRKRRKARAVPKKRARPKRRVRANPRRKTKRRSKPKTRRRNKPMPRKSVKRSRAAKKGWRKRKGNPAPKRRRRRKAVTNPVRRRRRKGTKAKRSAAAKKGWRKRKRSYNPVRRRRRRRRNTWFKQPIRHRRASTKGWFKRKRGGKRKTRSGSTYYYRTTRGQRHKQPRKSRGAYRMWRNPKHFIRTRNPNGIKDIALPVALAIGGLVGASLLMSKLPATIKAKIPTVAGVNLGIFVPAVAGITIMSILTKKMPKHSKLLYGLGFGMVLATGLGVYNTLIAPKIGLPAAGAMAGYVTTPMSGYVRSMSGYVRAGGQLGQMEEHIPRTLGAAVEYRGNTPPAIVPPTKRALAYQPEAVKPYGLGVPTEERRYNEFSWRGVYRNSVYEQ